VEVTVVMVLVVVLAGMTLPMLAGAAASTHLKEQAQALLAAARYAREYAVTHRVDCRLVIDPTAGQYALQRLDEDAVGGETFVSIGLGWGRPVVLEGGVRLGRVQIDPADGRAENSWITFRPSGQADAALVEITDGRWVYTLLVVPGSGRATLTEGTVRAIPNDRVDLDA
jgi:type II secretory pathway pseudopilin PulG